ncbi:hypothetical protein ACQRIU_001272 [Beauveria bassiana]
MEHTTTGEPNPVDSEGLCLLSLDGGGVRGLSTLFILKGIMARLNHERKEAGLPSAKPCEVFDLIGGTSTGGLIAIMLGRLEMDIDECISTYVNLMKSVFEKKSSWLPVSLRGNVKAQFDSKKLRSAVEQAINQSGASPQDRFNDGQFRGCRVFVCAAAKETSDITRLRSYDLPGKTSIEATILDAALATSAATRFFDPVRIGARQFVDGALGANNPVEQVEREASDIWCADTAELMPQVKCFLSVGTGHPGTKAIEDNIVNLLSKTLVGMVTETEQTEARFIARWRQHYDLKRYFRFNVDHGLEGVGLEEFDQQGTMEAATESYLDHTAQITRVRDCVLNLKQKQNETPTTFASVIREYSIRLMSKQTNSREPCWTVPFEKNLRFVGRASLLDKLEAALFAKERPPKISLFGLGGVGKTQVALELAYRTREKYPECSIIWIPTNNTARLRQAYIDAAEQLGIAVTDDKSDVKQLVQRYLSRDSAGRWLLIYDNADDFDVWIPSIGNQDGLRGLLEYVPRGNQGCVIFTTRNKKIALRLSSGGLREEVTQMDDDTALQLLYGRLNQKVPERHEEGQALIKELCHLPLAIVQAAAYIDANQSSLEEYLDLLNEQEEDVVELLSEKFGDEGSCGTVKDPVATTWLISFIQIRRSDPVAAEYLSLMSCFDPKDIPQSLLPPAKSRKEEVDALGTLTAYAFVSRQPATVFLDMHRLVHFAMRNWLKREKTFSVWMHKAVTRLDAVFPAGDHESRNVWRLYLPHARRILPFCFSGEAGEQESSLAWKFGLCTYEDGWYSEAESCFSHATETDKTRLGADHPSTLTSMAKLASTYRKQGRWEEAERLEVLVMETRKTKLGADHPDTLTSMANLASTFWNQGRWEEAERLEVQVMETRKTKLGADHPSTLTSMAKLASTYRKQGRWEEAERLEVQVMETRKTKLRADHPDTLTSMANLASTFWNQGRWEEAERLEVQVMETSKTKLGADHPDTLTSMANVASTYRNQGRWEEAERLEVQVMETTKTKLGADHPDTLTSMANLASTFWNQGRWEEAEKLDVQVMETSKTKLGADHPDTLTSMANLASTFWNQGRWEEAERLEVQVMETSKTKLGADHPSTLTSMANLASTYRNQGRWEEAERLEVQVMETRKTKLGADHPDTLTSMANLASTFWNQGRWEEAERLEVQVMETRKTKLGVDHPDTLSSMHNLSYSFKSLGRLNEALDLMDQCSSRRQRILGLQHPHTKSSKQAMKLWQQANYISIHQYHSHSCRPRLWITVAPELCHSENRPSETEPGQHDICDRRQEWLDRHAFCLVVSICHHSFYTAIRDALSTANKFMYCNQQTYWQCYVYAHAIERYSVEIKYINGGGVAVVCIFGFLYCVATTGASANDIAS